MFDSWAALLPMRDGEVALVLPGLTGEGGPLPLCSVPAFTGDLDEVLARVGDLHKADL